MLAPEKTGQNNFCVSINTCACQKLISYLDNNQYLKCIFQQINNNRCIDLFLFKFRYQFKIMVFNMLLNSICYKVDLGLQIINASFIPCILT